MRDRRSVRIRGRRRGLTRIANAAVLAVALPLAVAAPAVGPAAAAPAVGPAVGPAVATGVGGATPGAGSGLPAVGSGTPDEDHPQVKLTAADGASGDRFGRSVAVAGDTAVAGAILADVNGNPAQGAAYVFNRDGDGWTASQKLTAAGGQALERFGGSMALDGDTLLIGAWGFAGERGAVYVFGRDGDRWTEQARLTAADGGQSRDFFGEYVAVHGDTALIGAPGVDGDGTDFDQGAAYVFTRDTAGRWHQQARLTAPDGGRNHQLGRAVALAGDTALVGAPFANGDAGNLQGKVYAFGRDQAGWGDPAILTASDPAPLDRFGFATAVAATGDTAVIGAIGAEAGGTDSAGAAYVFVRDGGGWRERAKLAAADGAAFDNFGLSVAVAPAGDRAVVGADFATVGDNSLQGAAYLFADDADGDGWTERAKLVSADGEANDGFSHNAVAIDGRTVLVGSQGSTVDGVPDRGAAYLFALPADDPDPEPPACDRTITGVHAGPVTVTGGVTCLAAGALVLGEVNVQAGAGLRSTAAVVQGPITAVGAAGLELSYTQLTGPVLAAGGTGTVHLLGNQVTGSVSLTGNLTAEAPVVAGNTVIGTLSCFGNQPAPTDLGLPNTATGGKLGQCADGPPPLEIVTGELPTLHVLERYEATLAAAHGTPPYRWSATSLPAGLVLDPATGVIANDPAAPAITSRPDGPVTVTVTDDAGDTAEAALPLPAVVLERMAAGNDHVCAVTSERTVYCWGRNISGQLGDGTIEDRSLPAPVVDPDDPTRPFTGAVAISAREAHTCVTTVDGGAYCWGFNGAGRLGLGHESSEVIPVPGRVVGPAGGHLDDVVAISAGVLHTCARTGAGLVLCWGDNFRGQLGWSGHSGGVPGFVQDPDQSGQPLTGLAGVGAGGFHSCVVTVATTGFCFGWNHVGQLGTGSTVPIQSSTPLAMADPADPSQPLTGLDHVDGGTVHSCAGTTAGTGFCWGQNAAGQLGNGDAPVNNPLPQQVRDPADPAQPLAGLRRVGSGVLHSCAVTVAQTGYCWGSNDTGQLGDGSTDNADLPVPVADPADPGEPLAGVAALAFHGWQTCAVTTAGLGYCWGNNTYGQLGDGTTEHRSLPTPVHPGPGNP